MSEFAMYYKGYGWYGTLVRLTSGHGYMMKTAKGGSGWYE